MENNTQTHSFCFPLEFSVAAIINAFVEQNSGGTKKPGANLLLLCGSDLGVQRTRICCSHWLATCLGHSTVSNTMMLESTHE